MFTADAHCDTLHQLERGRIPKMISKEALCRGGVGLQVFALFNGNEPPLFNGIEQALYEISLLPSLGISLWKDALPEIPPEGLFAVFSIEGAEILEDSLEALSRFRREGVRMMNLTWNHENSLAVPALVGKGGVKPFGRTMLEAMGREGVLADVSHLNEDGFWDVLEFSRLPVVASHSCARSLCDHPRNLTDQQIRALIETHGFMGINFCPSFLSEDEKADLNTIADHIDHVAQMGGIHILGMGSDFDGIDGTPLGMENASCYPALWEKLEKRGYNHKDIAAIAGENLYNVLRRGQEGIK